MNPQDENDRKPRFNHESTRERAASQPPRTNAHSSSPLMAFREAQLARGPASPNGGARAVDPAQMKAWSHQRYPPLNRALTTSSATPGRSASFSAMSERGPFAPSSLRGESAFPSTFEDDEDTLNEDEYDMDSRDYALRPQNGTRDPDVTRSRSQSLAAAGRVGLKLNTALGKPPGLPNWANVRDRVSSTSSRYGEIQPPSRYTPTATSPHSSSAIPISRGYQPRNDVSNMSPFARDVTHMLLEEQQVRDLWGTNHQFRDETGPASGTTSRRHSVSVVQPRRGLGFTPVEIDPEDMFNYYNFGTRSMMISDEELAADLSSRLTMGDGPVSPSHGGPPSQPASLPVYTTPRGMSPESRGRYIPMNLPVSRAGHSMASSYAESLGERGLSTSPGVSPARGTARGEISSSPSNARPASSYRRGQSPGADYRTEPTSAYYPSSAVSFGDAPEPPLAEMGKGVPLHAVPSSTPLYIVEFKAGRTDLFYCADRALDVRAGDLVIVEGDRGRDLGKVINDSITPAEVEAFQRAAAAKLEAPPLSPGGTAPKRDVAYNPKRIYSKAHPGDAQSLVVKAQDEEKALQMCQNKVKQKNLPMDVVDAEYQWDRRKLTFYFVSDKRIDFRELVRELFRLYKTRIWMASLQGPAAE